MAIDLVLFSVSVASLAQQSSGSPAAISGYLFSLNGSFSLLTPKGERFIPKGDHNMLFSNNGKQVEIKGTPKSTKKSSGTPKPGEFHVSTVKKLADVCQ
jgi:hypothetical protein